LNLKRPNTNEDKTPPSERGKRASDHPKSGSWVLKRG
jgi:hypothetical protein